MNRLLYILLFLSFQVGYLEWGGGNSAFIFQAEGEIISKMGANPSILLHPFVLLPLLGQLILMYALFFPNIDKRFIFVLLFCLGGFMLFLFFIGMISLNLKILISTLPFWIISSLT